MNEIELTLRQRRILYTLQNRSEYITSSELAGMLRVSSRTIRNDINQMNAILSPHQAVILSTNSKGFLFQAEDPDRIRQLSRVDNAFFSRDERIRYLAFRLCQSEVPLNLYDLEDEVFVSRTALLADLAALKHRFSYAQPYIRIFQKHDEIWLEADELKIRSLLLFLFHENWDYDTQGNAYYGYHFLDEALLNMLIREVPGILYRHGICMDDPTLTALSLTLTIMHYRAKAGHPFPEHAFRIDEDSASWEAVLELFQLMESHTHYAYSPSEQGRIFEFITTARLITTDWQLSWSTREKIEILRTRADAENFRSDSERQNHLDLEYAHAFRYLDKILEIFSVDFTKDTEFVQILSAFLHQLRIGNSIFSQHQDLRAVKENLTAEYELAFLFQLLAPDFINRYLTEGELCNLAICLSGAIRHYLEVHPEKKLQGVLVCHKSMAAAWGLKRQILESLQLYLDITEILPVNFTDHYDFSDVDLILTTVKKKIADPGMAETMIIDEFSFESSSDYAMRIKLLSFKNIWPIPSDSLETLFSHAFWRENQDLMGHLQVIEEMGADFLRDKIAGEHHILDIIQRDRLVSFAARPGLVFLYTILPAAQTRLSILTLRHRIRWDDYKVSTVVMAMFRKEDLNDLFHLKVQLCNRPYNEDLLKKYKTREELLPYLLGKR